MFRNVPRSSYREGEKRVDVWLSLAQHGMVRRLAGDAGVSMGDWVAEAVREKVERDADAGAGCGVRVAAQAGGGGPRGVSFGDGEDHAGVGPRGADVSVDPFVGMSVAPAVDTGFVNLTGNPKLDALNAGIERVMAEKAAARSAVFDAPAAVDDPWDAIA